jgi:uncharacterized protein
VDWTFGPWWTRPPARHPLRLMRQRRTDTDVVTVMGPQGPVAERCELADSARTRLRGLLGRDELPHGSGLLLRPSGSVHTCFMRFPIDVVLLSGDLDVLRVVPALRPWRACGARGAKAVLELPAGAATAAGLAVGQRLRVEEAAVHAA